MYPALYNLIAANVESLPPEYNNKQSCLVLSRYLLDINLSNSWFIVVKGYLQSYKVSSVISTSTFVFFNSDIGFIVNGKDIDDIISL